MLDFILCFSLKFFFVVLFECVKSIYQNNWILFKQQRLNNKKTNIILFNFQRTRQREPIIITPLIFAEKERLDVRMCRCLVDIFEHSLLSHISHFFFSI